MEPEQINAFATGAVVGFAIGFLLCLVYVWMCGKIPQDQRSVDEDHQVGTAEEQGRR